MTPEPAELPDTSMAEEAELLVDRTRPKNASCAPAATGLLVPVR